MQHDPEPLLPVEAQLDEMIAGSKRAYVVRRARACAAELWVLGQNRGQATLQRFRRRRASGEGDHAELIGVSVAPRAAVVRTAVVGAPMRDRGLDRAPDRGQIVR